MAASGQSGFQNSYEISPIVLVGGIAGNVSGGVPGAMLPIASLLQSGNYGGLTGQPGALTLDEYFAHFTVLAGGTLMVNEIAKWPLANQAVAANAVITQPPTVSLLMTCPARTDENGISYIAKQAVMTALQSSLSQHIALGGWFNVATPSFIYQGCLLTRLEDASEVTSGGQVQVQWRWDFEQPLITTQQAQGAQNQAMSKITAGAQNSGDPPGSDPAAQGVNNPMSNMTPNLVPAGAQTAGVNAVPQQTNASPVAVTTVAPIPPGSI